MTQKGLSRLTDGQKACLRMVYRHMSSKDIGRALGISPHTVDQRLRVAMHMLGVCNRIEAARLLVQGEEEVYQSAVYQSPYIVPEPAPAETVTLALDGPEGQEENGRHFRQAQALYSAATPADSRFCWPLRKRGARHNDLETRDTLIWVAAIPIGAMVAIGMLATALNVLATLIGFPLANFR